MGSPHPRGDGPAPCWITSPRLAFSPPAWGWSVQSVLRDAQRRVDAGQTPAVLQGGDPRRACPGGPASPDRLGPPSCPPRSLPSTPWAGLGEGGHSPARPGAAWGRLARPSRRQWTASTARPSELTRRPSPRRRPGPHRCRDRLVLAGCLDTRPYRRGPISPSRPRTHQEATASEIRASWPGMPQADAGRGRTTAPAWPAARRWRTSGKPARASRRCGWLAGRWLD